MKTQWILNISLVAIITVAAAVPLSSPPKEYHVYNAFLIANNTYMLFKLIEPGTFIMGSQDTNRQKTDGPPHKVTITKPFYVGVYEVTQQQWNRVMRKLTWSNPSTFGGRLSNPVENISWREANEFLEKVNEFNYNSHFRLPTEAEWEYACRAGTTTRTYWGDDVEKKAAIWFAWLGGSPNGTSHPVGQLAPNAWGLYDMCGNVVEFTQDKYTPYSPEDQIDPVNNEGKHVVGRGGDWFHAGDGDSEARRTYNEDGGLSFLGFRVVREVEE